MSQKCLVTGAAGFIGSHLVDRLLERGGTVLGVDNMKLGRRANLAPALENKRFKFVECDVNDLPTFLRHARQQSHDKPFDIVWHMAANSDIRAGVFIIIVSASPLIGRTFSTTRPNSARPSKLIRIPIARI